MDKGKLNVLYVIPRYKTYCMANHYVMPLGILYVSAYVKRSRVANVYTLNLNHVDGEEFDILNSYITDHRIDVFGVGGLSGEYVDVSRMAQYAKRINPKVQVVVGGGIMTADPETTMKAIPEADFGIIGEGELTSTELLEAMTDDGDVEAVDGLIFRSGDTLRRTSARKEIVDLDSLPFPDYEGFNYDEYLKNNPDMSDEGKKYSQVSVIGGRSCKFNCTFCFHPSGTTYRQRSLDSIFSEIDYLVEHYDISYIALREELFATDNKRVADFCKRIEKYDFDWSIQLRIDSINQELVDLLKGTRCRYVFVGVESASNEVLKSMHKGITLEQIERALDMLNDVGLNSRSGVIFGDSAETYETAMFTLDWFLKNRDRYRMFVDMIIAFPGSILYKRSCKAGIIPDPVRFLQEGCPIVNVSKMGDRQFAELVSKVEKINYRKYNVKYYNEQL
ncbi:MAG: B12-binding domain-containing radical SAM protein [Candidatus Cryptobacteroides sp.]